MKTELELEFKKETGFRPKIKQQWCKKCGEHFANEDLYESDFVDFLIAKIENYENSRISNSGN